MKRIRTFIIVSVVILGASLAFHLGRGHGEIAQMSDLMPSESIAQIAFQCVDENEVFNICVVNSDGTGFAQLTEVNSGAGNFSPVINDSGQIVYSCRDDFDHNLCLINSDGSGFTMLTIDSRELRENRSAYINNQGLVVYRCEDLVNLINTICTIDTASLEIEAKTSGDAFRSRPIINDLEQIVFICSEDGIFNLCALDGEHDFERKLTFRDVIPGHRSAAFASINDAGQVAFNCVDVEGNLNVCSIHIDGEEPMRLTNSVNPRRNGRPSINNDGLIAYFCTGDPLTDGICVINSDGSGFRQLMAFSDFTSPSWLRMNDAGLIVFNCPEETKLFSNRLCIINSDGTDFRELIAVPEGHRYFNASINN